MRGFSLFNCPVCLTLCNHTDCNTPGLPVPHQLPKFAKFKSIESVVPSNHLILWCPLLLLPLIFPSIGVFSNESAFRLKWAKYRSFSFSISPSNEYSELISFQIDCFDPFAVQGTLRSLLQHFFIQLSQPYVTTGKTTALSMLVMLNHSVMSNSVRPYGLQLASLLCPWDSLGKDTRVGCYALLQGTFPTQGSKPGLLHCRQILYHWATREAPVLTIWGAYILIEIFTGQKAPNKLT